MRYRGGNRQERVDDAIGRHGFDALVALTPENAAYLSGRTSLIATLWRVPGLVAVAVGATGAAAVAAGDNEIAAYPAARYARFPHPLWIEHLDLQGVAGADLSARLLAARPSTVARPAQYDPGVLLEAVADAILAVAAPARRIGADLATVPGATLAALRARFPPGAEFVDATAVFDELRAVKDADEIAHLRLAAELTEVGIAAAREALRPGLSETGVAAAYQTAIWNAAAADRRYAGLRAVEGLVAVGDGTAGGGTPVGAGQTVKLDMQVDVGGYHSDIGRTYAAAPTADQRAVHAALAAALAALTTAARPGASFGDLHAIGRAAMREAGFPTYSRGHLGHSVGLAHNYEEPPFVAAAEEGPLEPGMVLSLELPYYLGGLGSFQLERMVLITEEGHEPLDRLPFELAVAP